MKKIPAATEKDKKVGWTLNYEFMDHISTNTSLMGFSVSMEKVESVLLILKSEGYVDIDLEERP